MMLALGVLGILVLAAAIRWYAVRRPEHAPQPGAAELPHDARPVATAVPAESRASVDTDILEDTDETANSGGRDRKPVGKLSLLGDLAAGIAHEINNPVAIMVEEAGWIEDLLEEEEFRQSENLEEFKRALTQIKTQGARCKAIIQNLVSFGQKTGLKVGEVRVNDLVAEVVRAYDKRVRAGDVKIDTHFAEYLPDCRLSPSEMQQVLTNLINNALDAADPEAGRVEIRTRCDGPDVVVDVSDNGPGIPKALLDKIFDPFFTTKPVGKGTGLGLSICYSLIEKMGGNINVESDGDPIVKCLLSSGIDIVTCRHMICEMGRFNRPGERAWRMLLRFIGIVTARDSRYQGDEQNNVPSHHDWVCHRGSKPPWGELPTGTRATIESPAGVIRTTIFVAVLAAQIEPKPATTTSVLGPTRIVASRRPEPASIRVTAVDRESCALPGIHKLPSQNAKEPSRPIVIGTGICRTMVI